LTEGLDGPPRPRVRDLLRPAVLYRGILARPGFLLPLAILVASAMLYLAVASGRVLPSLVPDLLDRSLLTESALRRTLHASLLAASFALPLVWLPLAALVSWLALRVARGRVAYPIVVSLLAYSSLWIALDFAVKALLVVATGHPAPSTNLGALTGAESPGERALLSLTNPFLLAAVAWTARGLARGGASAAAAWTGGALPWVGTAVLFATVFAGGRGPGIAAPVPVDDWPVVTHGCITLRTPPELAPAADEVAVDLDGFARHLADRFGFAPRPLRVYLYPDHPTLERAIGERLHVLTTGSIRGSDLLYLEMPGRNAAVTADRGRRNALRFVGLMQLAPAAASAPRWFVEGVVHAMVEPGTPELDREFRATLRRTGLPSLAAMQGPVFRTPVGALLARSLVDHIAALHGPAALVGVMKDVVAGADFRDALYARTRLTASELEAGWQDNLRRLLAEGAPRDAAPGAAADTASAGAVLPRPGG